MINILASFLVFLLKNILTFILFVVKDVNLADAHINTFRNKYPLKNKEIA